MKNSATAAATESSRSQWLEPLTHAVNRLADEVRVARDVVDELTSHFVWAARNEAFRPVVQSHAESPGPSATPQLQLDDEQAHAIVQNIKHSLQDLAGDGADAVRQEMRGAPIHSQDQQQIVSKHEQPADNDAAADLDFVARKAFTASAVVSHIAATLRQDHMPSPSDRQRSLFDE